MRDTDAHSETKSLYILLEDMEFGEPRWTGEDLQAIWGHQLQSPLTIDLGGMRGKDANQIERMAHARGLTLTSFADLLFHPHPPVDLLDLTKEFAKRNLVSPENRLPAGITRVLYFGSIAIAKARCGTSITRLSDDEMMDGLEWCLAQTWLDPEVKNLLSSTLGSYSRELAQ